MIVNDNSIVQHVIQIKNEIMINANMSAKSIVSVKMIIVCNVFIMVDYCVRITPL